MKKILKRALKIFGLFFLLLIIAVICVPIFFGKQIKQAVKNAINEQVNAEVYFEDIGINVFSNFPNIAVGLDEFGVVGKDEFAGDTLLDVGKFKVVVNLWSVFFGDAYEVRKVILDRPTIHAKVLRNGKANWDIMKKSDEEAPPVVEEEPADTSKATPLNLQLRQYAITEGNVTFDDRSSDLFLKIVNLNHGGSGDFSEKTYDFDTYTTADAVTFRSAGVNYLRKAALDVDITLNIDNEKGRYTLKDNSFGLNDLVLNLDGWVEMPGDDINMDLKFSTARNTFKNILSMVPGMYSPDFGGLETNGTFTLDGAIKGTFNERGLPGFNVNLGVANGYFQYPDLPESVSDINFDLKVNSPDGLLKNIKINFPKFHAMFGQAPIDAKAIISGINPENMNLDASVKTNLDLATLLKMFPMEGQELRGNFKVDATAKGVYNFAGNAFPKVSAIMELTNGYYKTADFPSALENMSMNASMKNESGTLDNTSINVSKFHAEIDKEPFDATLSVKDISDPEYAATLIGKLNLDKLNKIYPIEGTTFGGLVDIDIETSGTVDAVEAGRYTDLPTKGNLVFTNLSYLTEGMPPIKINTGKFTFTPKELKIDNFKGNLGSSPVNITGGLSDYLQYVLLGETIHGNLSLTSSRFNVNEWLSEDGEAATPPPAEQPVATEGEAGSSDIEVFEVPDKIDFTFDCNINTVYYDDLTLQNLTGKVIMRDREISFKDLSFKTLGGNFRMNGSYNTRDITNPLFDLNMNLAGLDIQKTYNSFVTVQALAPVGKFVDGVFNSQFNLKGKLRNDMMPDMATLTSFGKMDIVNGVVSKLPILEKVSEKTKLNNFKEVRLKDTRILFEVKNGRIFVDPFDVNAGKAKMNVSGDNGIDGSINYKLKMDMPAGTAPTAALGNLAKLTGQKLGNAQSLAVNVGLGGTFVKPKITSVGIDGMGTPKELVEDIKEQVTEKVEEVKEEVKEQVTEKIEETKDKAIEEARKQADKILAEADKRADQVVAAAEKTAQSIRDGGKKAGDQIRQQAETSAKAIEDKAKNQPGPLKKAAKISADKVRKEGEEKARKAETEANRKADQTVQKAKFEADKIRNEAKKQADDLIRKAEG